VEQRLDAHQRFYEALRLQFVIGAADVEKLYGWARRLLDVDRETTAGAPPYERHRARMQRAAKDLDSRPRSAAATEADRLAVDCFLAEAELWAAGAKGEGVDDDVWARRVDHAKALFERWRATFVQGGASIELPYLWSTRWQQAARDREPSHAIKTLEQHLDRTLKLDGAARTKRPSDAAAATFFRWEAEYYVLAAKGERLADERRRKAFIDAWGDAAVGAWDATLGEFRARQTDVERVCLWSLRRFDAERVRGPDTSACEAHQQRLQRLEKELRARDDYGLGLALPTLELFRDDAAVRLERARASV
jgi:hypothetical protein